MRGWRNILIVFALLAGSLDTFAIRAVHFGNPCTGDFGGTVSRARYYSPQIGRFWTMDTYEGNQEDPQTLHKYLYCRANPVDAADPSGNSETLNLAAAGLIATAIAADLYLGLVQAKNTLQGRSRGLAARSRRYTPEPEPESKPGPKIPVPPVYPPGSKQPSENRMRLQLQDNTPSNSKEGAHYWSEVLVNSRTVGVTVLQVRTGLNDMHNDVVGNLTIKEFPASMENELYSAIIRFSQKLDPVRAGGGVTQTGNVLREKFYGFGVEYRIDLENLEGHNLRR